MSIFLNLNPCLFSFDDIFFPFIGSLNVAVIVTAAPPVLYGDTAEYVIAAVGCTLSNNQLNCVDAALPVVVAVSVNDELQKKYDSLG